MTRCQDPGRKQLLKESINQIAAWMEKNNTEPHLASMITSYMEGGGTKPMADIAQGMSHVQTTNYAECRLERMANI